MTLKVYRAPAGWLLTLALLPWLTTNLPGAQTWRVRLEEPTGIEPRVQEVVEIPLQRFGGHSAGFLVVDPDGKEMPWQATGGVLRFAVSLRPGQTPEYRVSCCAPASQEFANLITVHRAGMNRLVLANERFRVVIDLARAAIVEAYNLSAGPQRVLNLADLTPEQPDKNDIHDEEKRPTGPESPVGGENNGWTTLGGEGPLTSVEVLEKGPLAARVRLRRGPENWVFSFTASSPWLRWSGAKGFRFASISALPFLPFDRFADVSEYSWPTGPGLGEPPANRIGARPWKQPPDGHFVYYQKAENYGALGLVALDSTLEFTGAGSRKFEALSANPESEIALTFPRWLGNQTLLEARREARKLRNPVMVEVEGPEEGSLAQVLVPAPRQPAVRQELLARAPEPWQPETLPLDGAWQLTWGEKGGPPRQDWREVRVPGAVHVQWLRPEELYTREAGWVSRKVWWYRRKFTAPESWTGRPIRLEFDATDYYAEVFLDGRRVGRHEGYVDPWRLDVTDKVQPGREHELMVRVWTPVHYYWKHRPYTVKGAYGAVDQKPDDITATGITRSVRLKAGGAAFLEDASVATHLDGPERARLDLDLEASGDCAGCLWQVIVSPRNFSGAPSVQWTVPVSAARQRLSLPVEQPRLWHTWDTGFPHLYTLDVRLVDASGRVADGKAQAIGFREIERVGDHFYLNRRKLFLRGTNTYFHLFLSEMDRAAYERDFAIIRRMNVNALRLHCHFDNPEIYDLADEQGVLIWQDFLEAWYPRDPWFSRHAAALFDDHIRYVRNHPSVMAWAPSDEEDHVNYNDLAKHLAARAALLDPQMRYVQRSTGRYGDAHLYYGWYGGSIWQYARMTEPLVTELGAPSLPSRPSLERFLGGKWPMLDFADDWRFHRLQIEEAIQNIGDPRKMSLDEFIARSQDYTARLFQVALERARRNKSSGAAGIFHFFAIDIWPSVTMAAVDFYRQPMKVAETVRRSFQPVLASLEYTQDTWKQGDLVDCPLWVIHDGWQDLGPATLRWRIVDEAGNEQTNAIVQTNLKADTAEQVGVVKWRAGKPGSYRWLVSILRQGREVSENVVEFRVEP